MQPKFSVAILALALAGGTAGAQVVNGDFETGSLDPWAIGFTPNGATSVQTVEVFDIDGPGPLADSQAAVFGVGNAATPNQPNQGIEMTQSLALTGGVAYTIKFDYAATRISAGNNADGGQFAIIVDGTSLTSVATGSTSATNPHYGNLSTVFTPPSSGNYVVGARIGRNFLPPGDLFQHVDNFSVDGGPAPCYPDCNGDSVLNLSDFGCFTTKFALGDPYADCNGDTVLNLSDFGCFTTKFALGCP
ncbi:MAG: hypothetical protein IT437_05310 [Phycisphaerales bacterium]|nr:hypothetical protein [Phycisphaerales bacterium]